MTDPICNWCAEEPGQGLVLSTENPKTKSTQDHIICASCGLKAILKSLGKPKIKPVIKFAKDDFEDCSGTKQ